MYYVNLISPERRPCQNPETLWVVDNNDDDNNCKEELVSADFRSIRECLSRLHLFLQLLVPKKACRFSQLESEVTMAIE